MKNVIPDGATAEVRIVEPAPEWFGKLDEWQQLIKKELEDEGLIVTDIEGGKFTGYFPAGQQSKS